MYSGTSATTGYGVLRHFGQLPEDESYAQEAKATMIPGKSAKLSYFSINIVVSQVLGQAEVGIVVAH